MKRTKLILREISNYFFLQRVINRESKLEKWSNFKLRASLAGRIYTVINLRDEDMGDDPEVRRFKAMLLMKPVNEYLESLDLREIISPSMEELPGTRSFLVVYTPLFRELTWAWLISRVLFVAAAVCTPIILAYKYFG